MTIKTVKLFTLLYFLLFNLNLQAEIMDTQLTSSDTFILQSADSDHFTGKAAFIRYPLMPSHGDVAPAIVHFEPNGFTNWHAHSQGQYLIVIEGTGRFQQWGKPIQLITQGDVVWIAPNVKHWHGAGEYTAMSHIAISPAKDNMVTWMEKVQPESVNNPIKIETTNNQQLTAKQLVVVPLAIAVTEGDQIVVKKFIEQGLKIGLTVNELKELVSHQFAYIGAPKTLNAMITLKTVLEERIKQGINDPQGSLPTQLGRVNYYELGTQKLAQLTHRPTKTAIFDFAPAIDYAIKAQLFGYQFSRDNLGDFERELATLGSLIGLGTSVNPQLRSHLTILRNLGLTETGINQLITQVSPKQFTNLHQVWNEINK